MIFSGVKSITIPEGKVKKITAQAKYTNQIAISTDVDGSPFIGANGEKGYKLNTRCSVSSGGYVKYTGYSCTGLIPCKYNDTLCVQYIATSDYIILFNNARQILGRFSFRNLFGSKLVADGTIYKSQLNKTPATNEVSFENVAYIVINTTEYMTDKSVVTINEPIGEVVLWEAPTGRIPSEYQEVEYIANTITTQTSGSYIDLGFAFNEGATTIINFIPASNGGAHVFGAAENSGKLRYMITDNSAQSVLYGYDGSGYTALNFAQYNGEKHIKYTAKEGLLKGEDLINNTSNQRTEQKSFVMTNNLYLFAQNYNGSARVALNGTKINSFSYYDKTDTLICDLVPCYRKSDGVIGMYDIVRKIFLTNAGTNSFTKGADV